MKKKKFNMMNLSNEKLGFFLVSLTWILKPSSRIHLSKLAQYTEKSGIPLNLGKMVVMGGKKFEGK